MMRDSKRKCVSDSWVKQEGSVMVEFAVSVVLLLVMVFGVVDFGRALYTYHFLSNAARDATRWASVNGSSCTSDPTCPNGGPASQQDIASYIDRITPAGINPNSVIVAANWPRGTVGCSLLNPSDAPGCPVQVQVSYQFNFLVPLVHNGSINLSSSSEAIISH